MSSTSSLTLDRKLTPHETSELRDHILRPLFASFQNLEDDVNDVLDYTLAMLANHKDATYIETELEQMEMECCPPEVVKQMTHEIQAYIARITGASSSTTEEGGAAETTSAAATAVSPEPKRGVISLKKTATLSSSPGTGVENALTRAGALGSHKKQAADKKGPPPAASRDKERKDRDDGESGRNSRSQNGGGRGGRGGRGRDDGRRQQVEDRPPPQGGSRRNVHGEAFDRLTLSSSTGRGGGRGDRGREGPGRRDDPGRGGGTGRGSARGRRDNDDEEEDEWDRRRGAPAPDRAPHDRNVPRYDRDGEDTGSGRGRGRSSVRGGGEDRGGGGRGRERYDDDRNHDGFRGGMPGPGRGGRGGSDRAARGGGDGRFGTSDEGRGRPEGGGGGGRHVPDRHGEARYGGRGGGGGGRHEPEGRGYGRGGGRGFGSDNRKQLRPEADDFIPAGADEDGPVVKRARRGAEDEGQWDAAAEPQQYDEQYEEHYDDGQYYEGGRGGGGRHGYVPRGGGRGYVRGGGRYGGRGPWRGGRSDGRGGGYGRSWHADPSEGQPQGGEDGGGAGDEGYDAMDTQAGAEGGDADASAAEAAANHPSPLVAANYWGSGYAPRGRGFVRGGRGGFAAARGRGGGRTYYRAQVQTMLASKTWVRKKDGDNDGGGEGGPGDAADHGEGGGSGGAPAE